MNIFEITIQPKTDQGWPVAVKHTLSQQSRLYYKSTLNLDSRDNFAELGQYLGQPNKYGIELGKKLFTQEIRFAFAKALSDSQQQSDRERKILSVFLHIDTFNDDSLKTLRWERLCAPFGAGDDDWEYLSTDRRTTFSIYLPTMTERLFRVIGKNDLRALIVVANPSNSSKYGLADFDVQKTVDSVRASMDDIPSDLLANGIDGAVGLPTLEQLKAHLSSPDKYYTLLHLVCHGKFVKGETIIYLADNDNRTKPIKTSVLIKELKDLPRAPHFAFLSTCESAKSGSEMGGLAQSLAQKLGMPAVLGMTDPVTIYTAQELAAAFYQELREHGDVSFALTQALIGLRTKRDDVTVPVLFSRLAGKPIFSQELDRELSTADIQVGIQRLRDNNRQLLKERSPVLIQEFEQQEKKLGNLNLDVAALSEYDRNLRQDALKELNSLCQQVLDVTFNALALTGEVTEYDSRCPFKGLKPFRKEDKEFFCGRESLIETLKNKLEKHNFLAVLGASGTGKSSVVLAGLIPVLERQQPGIKVIEFTPDHHPLANLQENLSGVEQQSLVVVVDQFEEVFTLCEKTNRDNFITELLKLAEFQKVIITMRADFWGECAENEKLKEVMLKNQELISPMNGEELRKAIEEQAEKVGLRFESGVVNLIQKDVESAPGEMPLLQYALEELWQRRRGKWLLSEEYNKIGFKEAIARTADSFYHRLSEVEKEQVQNIFLRLTRLDESLVLDDKPKYTRQRIYLKDLITSENFQIIEKLIQRLAGEEARLVVTRAESSGSGVDGEQQITVEVAHEALITHWPKLQGWLEENRTNLQLRQSIREASLEWRNYQEESFLVHYGNRLAGAEALLQEKGFLNESEIAYVNACISRQRDEQERELLQERKARRAAQRTTGISIFATILVAGLGLIAWNQKNEAQRNKIEVLTTSSLSLLDTGKELEAFIFAIKAGKLLPKDEKSKQKEKVIESLAANIDRGSERNRLEGHDDSVSSVSFSPDGKILASGSSDTTIKLWDVETGDEILTLEGDSHWVQSISFSPDGQTLASGHFFSGDNNYIKLWDVKTGKEIRTLQHKGPINTVSFSPDGQILASGGDKNDIKLWDVKTGEEKLTLQHKGPINTVSFSPDGQILASDSDNNTIKLWDVETGKEIRTFQDDDRVNSVSFSPDGQILASGSYDNTIKLWDVETGKEIRTLQHDDSVNSVNFSPDGQILASGSYDNTIKLWDVETGKEIRTFQDDEPFNSISFSPNGQILASGSSDNTIKLLNVKTKEENRTFKSNDKLLYEVGFSPDGKILAYTVDDNTIKLWNVKTKEEMRSLKVDDKSLSEIYLSPDGRILAYTGDDNTIKVLNAETGENRTFKGHEQPVIIISFSKREIFASEDLDDTIKLWNVNTGTEIYTLKDDDVVTLSVSPDGKTFAVSSYDHDIKLWDVKTGEKIHTLKGHRDLIYSLSFSPDGKTLASGGRDKTIKLWDVGNGAEINTLEDNKDIYTVSFSPDGKTLASGGRDKTIKLWDVNTGQEKLTLKGHDKGIESLSFSPDGQILASRDEGNTIKLWTEELSPDFNTLMKENCDWVRNYLQNNPNVEKEDRDLCDNIGD